MPALFCDFVLVVTATTAEEQIPKCARGIEQKQENRSRHVAWKLMAVLERQNCFYNLMG